ncbi:hypothetical protein GCM10028801_20780 [Nocardioides maradonensis]
MTLDAALFGDEEPSVPVAAAATPAPIAEWQVERLRKALDARGLSEMSDRQRAIEEALGRRVASLRELSSEDANRVLGRFGATATTSSGSQWDERDEDTWIDRL